MKLVKVLAMTVLAVAFAAAAPSCDKPDIPQPKPIDVPDDEPETPEDTERPTEPATCTNKVVAHRGGARESGRPDNSRAGLMYAMSLKCYAMECDIYWTKDNNVVIAHATDTYYINGLKPWEHTLLELRKAGKLKNGEELPTLEEFLDAEKFCEFICTGNETVAAAAANCMVVYGIPVGWMANKAPSGHKAMGYTWANLSAASYMTPYGGGSRTIDEFKNAGMEISVFNIDQASGDGNAVYSADAVNYYVSRYADLRFICTNYPAWLLNKLK